MTLLMVLLGALAGSMKHPYFTRVSTGPGSLFGAEFFFWMLSTNPIVFGALSSVACPSRWLFMGFMSKFAPDAGGSGIPHQKGYLEGFLAFLGWRILFVKFIGGIIGIGSGLALGTGTDLIENVLKNTVASHQLLMYFILRFILTIASYSTGAPGGIFAPLLQKISPKTQ